MSEFWEFEALYKTDNDNPVYVFAAFKAFRKAGLQPPEWVCEALGRMADNLEPLIKEPPKKDVEAAAGGAIGFCSTKKGDNPFFQAKVELETRACMTAYIKQRRAGLTDTAAQQAVAKIMNSNSSTVRRRFQRFIKDTSFTSASALFEATLKLPPAIRQAED